MFLPVVLVVGCSTGLFYDPVFVSVGPPRTSAGPCADGSTCVDVPLTAVPEAVGRSGRCELYPIPGDPETMEPLVSEDVQVPADADDGDVIAFMWETTVPLEVAPRDLNPVCSPMVEG